MAKKSVSFFMEKKLQKYMTPEAKQFTLSEWYRFMFPYIPFITGTLASTTEFGTDLTPEQAMLQGLESIKDNIHFRVPYASNQNNGDNFNFTKDLHPMAQAHWEQVAADLHGDQIVKELKDFIKRSENK